MSLKMEDSKHCVKYKILLNNSFIIMATAFLSIVVSVMIVYFNIDTEVIKNNVGDMAFVWFGAASFFLSKFFRSRYEDCDDGWCRELFLGLTTLFEVFTLCLIGVELYSSSDKNSQELSIMPIVLIFSLGMLITAKYHKRPLNYREKISSLDESVNKINTSIDNIIKNEKSQKKSYENIEVEVRNCIWLEINRVAQVHNIIGELNKIHKYHDEIKSDKKD